jgi:mono/diheme cytochrome c family protein
MNQRDQEAYLARYREAKEHGDPFFPDVIFKDVVISLIVFLTLAALAYFAGVPTEPRADPADTTYTPRPEGYFLFLFQLLKYFPGNLEVIGAVIIPTIVIGLLVALPFIDRSPRRHFLNRPVTSLAGAGVLTGVVVLTVLAVREAPPPQAAAEVDEAAALYSSNCAACHGPSMDVPPGTDLHEIIAQGNHAGMPAWGADLSTDEIDALAGFVLSPRGSDIYTHECGVCHELTALVARNPADLRTVLDQAEAFPSHVGLAIPVWNETLSVPERNALLNFLAAPDGQRLFSINCAGCHGVGVGFPGDEAELRQMISEGGQHRDMPAWGRTLGQADLDALISYVSDPASSPNGAVLFGQHCATCHRASVPTVPDRETAAKVIATGGPHLTMPDWGSVLTPEQLDALVQYALAARQGSGAEIGAQLYAENCADCHGLFGEGGPNPSRADDVIAPIGSAEYLRTRDDGTLSAIITQGQPDFGMSPFGAANGGPLSDEAIGAIVAFLRSWEADPPVELPPEVKAGQAALSGVEVFAAVCSRCHGANGEGGIGPALADPQVQGKYDDQGLFDTISLGHDATEMLPWGDILTPEQIEQLVRYIRSLQPVSQPPEAADLSFAQDILPLLDEECYYCHNARRLKGGWDGSTYDGVMATGDNAPVVVPGDSRNSLLAQKMLGIQTEGDTMPPQGLLGEDQIQLVIDWINTGAPNN